MNKRHLICLFALLLFSSCRTSGDIKREKELSELRQELSSVQNYSAETGQDLNSIRDDINSTKGLIEKLQYKADGDKDELAKTDESIKQSIKDLEARLEKIQKEITDSMESMKNDFREAVKKLEEISENENKPKAKAEEQSGQNKADIDTKYKKARKLHKAKNYEEAEKYYASAAGTKSKWYDERIRFFWGTLLFDQNKDKDAVIKLQEFIEAYPNSQYAPVALNIQGQCFLRMKKPKDAKVFFQDIVSKYPDSKEAKEAKERLKKL